MFSASSASPPVEVLGATAGGPWTLRQVACSGNGTRVTVEWGPACPNHCFAARLQGQCVSASGDCSVPSFTLAFTLFSLCYSLAFSSLGNYSFTHLALFHSHLFSSLGKHVLTLSLSTSPRTPFSSLSFSYLGKESLLCLNYRRLKLPHVSSS